MPVKWGWIICSNHLVIIFLFRNWYRWYRDGSPLKSSSQFVNWWQHTPATSRQFFHSSPVNKLVPMELNIMKYSALLSSSLFLIHIQFFVVLDSEYYRQLCGNSNQAIRERCLLHDDTRDRSFSSKVMFRSFKSIYLFLKFSYLSSFVFEVPDQFSRCFSLNSDIGMEREDTWRTWFRNCCGIIWRSKPSSSTVVILLLSTMSDFQFPFFYLCSLDFLLSAPIFVEPY